MVNRKYDVVIFGATGFTGKHVIIEAVKVAENEKFKWAVAGRTESKLDSILREISEETGKDLKDVDKIIADVSNPESLRAMAKQCTVVLNCVGPYILWGEVVVKACVEEGTSHLDLSAESQFLEKMQISYNESAENKGCYIIGACGFDSIPTDYGSIYLENNFDGVLNSIETYAGVDTKKLPVVNYGTFHSVLIIYQRFSEFKSLTKQLFPKPYFNFEYKLTNMPVHYNEDAKAWGFHFDVCDERVMKRTQAYKYYKENRRPADIRAYILTPHLILTILLFIGSQLGQLFLRFESIFRFIANHPKLLSLGMVTPPGKNPTKKEMDIDFAFTVIGKGWDKSVKKSCFDTYLIPPNKKMVLRVQGNNPGYTATAKMMLQAGLTIIKEQDLMPSKGGVYTAGIAFGRSTLADRLTKSGVTFTLEKEKKE